jgi:hypothetical protein
MGRERCIRKLLAGVKFYGDYANYNLLREDSLWVRKTIMLLTRWGLIDKSKMLPRISQTPSILLMMMPISKAL